MVTIDELNVTQIEPRLKHPTIFKHFDELEPGEGFVIYNDHDPKPLYYQLLGERGDIFKWEYLEQGPDVYRVRISKRNTDAQGNVEPAGALSEKEYRKAETFKSMGADFSCDTDKKAKADNGKSILNDKNKALEGAAHDYSKWQLDFLADYIVNIHHQYIKNQAEVLTGLAQKVAEHHGDNHTELPELAENVTRFMADMQSHMLKEERALFPKIRQLAVNKRNPGSGNELLRSIRNELDAVEQDHNSFDEDLQRFRTLTSDYKLPADACNSYAYLFEKMKEFENDLVRHVYIEDNILFPKVLEMEKELA